jgi:hypothetical protein
VLLWPTFFVLKKVGHKLGRKNKAKNNWHKLEVANIMTP